MRRISSLEVEQHRATAHDTVDAAHPPAPEATVLVVDDNPATRRFVRETLEIEGYRVVEAAGGSEALERCSGDVPDLVIIDLCMSDMRGTVVVAHLRARPELAGVPVIVFTGAPEELPDTAEAGFDDLIAKPADATVLLETVRGHLAARPEAAPEPTASRRALVVDGDLARSVRSRLLLRRLGFDVTIVTTAADALRSARTARPDLVVAELVLADMTALELTRDLRADPRLGDVPVVLTSPAPWSQVQERLAERAGATAYITLTPDLAGLREAVTTTASAAPPAHPLPTPGVQGDVDENTEHLLRELHRQEAERRSAARSLERGKAEVEVLQSLAEVLRDPSDLDGVLTEALARSLHAIGASRGAVFLAELDGHFSMCAHLGDLGRVPGERIPNNEVLFQRIVETGETMVVDVASGVEQPVEPDVGPDVGPVVPLTGATSVVVAVESAGERFGTLVVEVPAHEDLRFWMHFLKLVGLGLGFAVANARRTGAHPSFDGNPPAPGAPSRDPLTGLADEHRLEEMLAGVVASGDAGRHDALLIVDVDRLRHVNDALGRSTGDELLRGIARRLEGAAGPDATVARMHGDVYAVLVPCVSGVDGARAFARRILRALDAPIRCNGYTLYATASVGVAVFPDHAAVPRDLVRHAHAALDTAKERGGNTFDVHTTHATTSTRQRLTVDQGLRAALERDEFTLHYQPIVDLATGAVVAAEGLLRWDRPLHGLTSAADFITVAEETGLIVPIGAWVLRQAALQVRDWSTRGLGPQRVAVNVGARELHDGDVAGALATVLDATRIDPSRLCLEVTETVALADVDHAVAVLDRVRDMGVKVALDDFGTGYSSLRYVHQLPLDTLKIDRSFVADAATDRRGGPILESMVRLAHDLGLSVVAEGIETPACLEVVRSLGVDEAQGWHLGRPAPPDELAALLP